MPSNQLLLLLLCNMFEYILCFSIVYLFFIPDLMSSNYWQSFAYSMSAFLNLNISGIDDLPHAIVKVVRIESILGIFMNLICIARFINLLPDVNTIEKQ